MFISWKVFFLILFLLFVASLFCFLYIPVALIKVLPVYKSFFASHSFGIFLYLFSSFLNVYIIYYFCCKRKKKSLFDGLFLKSVSNKIYIVAVSVGILMPIATLPIIFKFAPREFYAIDLLSQEGGFIYLFISALLAPIFEEIFYRGFMFPFFQSKFNSFWAVIIVSLFFGVSHIFNIGDSYVLLSLFIFYGFVLTLIRYFTKSLIPPMITHLIHNAMLIGGFLIKSQLFK